MKFQNPKYKSFKVGICPIDYMCTCMKMKLITEFKSICIDGRGILMPLNLFMLLTDIYIFYFAGIDQ